MEALLAHQGWVRSLALSLVSDPGRADDVAQETWLTAVRRPPARFSRAWLVHVVRSRARDLYRSESRRTARERRAVPGAASPGADEFASEAEVCRVLAEAVCALSPTRREVVLLHYYHGLTRREVAERLAVPLETVRTRLRRALAELRDRLDGKLGERGRWRATLLPLAIVAREKGLTSAGAALLTGGVFMGTKLKIAAGAAVLTAALLGVWGLTAGDGEREAPPVESEVPALPLVAQADVSEDERGPAAEAPARAEPEPASPVAEPAPEEPASPDVLTGRIGLTGGDSSEGTRVVLSWVFRRERGEEAEYRNREAAADREGRFRFGDLPAGSGRLLISRPGYGTREVRVRLDGAAPAAPVEIMLRRAGGLIVRVRGGEGQPVPRVELRIIGPHRLDLMRCTDGEGMVKIDDLVPGAWKVYPEGPSDGASSSRLRDPLGGRPVTVVEGETAELLVDLGLAVLTGTVQLPDGKPVVEGFLYFRRTRPDRQSLTTRTDANGRFRLETPAEGEFDVTVQVLTPVRFVCPAGKASLALGRSAEYPIRIPDTSISGRLLRGDDGAPIAKAGISARSGEIRGSAWPAEDGTFRFVGLPPGRYEVRVHPHDRRLAPQTETVELPASGRLEGVDLTFEAKPVGVLNLRVLGPDGVGCERVQVTVTTGTKSGTFPGKHLGGGVHEIILNPGKHGVEIFASGHRPERISVEIAEGETLEREVKLTPFRR